MGRVDERPYRFIQSQKADIKSKIAAQTSDIKTEQQNLENKLRYLETTAKNSREHIEKMLQAGGRA